MDTNYPDADEIEPDYAKHLFENCAILIVEQLPVGSEFGIDLFTFRTGEKFKGVKMIPPGVHFIYAGASDKRTQQIGFRTGFLHNFQPKEMLIRRWSETDEDFDDSYSASDEQRHRYQVNLKDLDSFLGAYRFSSYRSFVELTDMITPKEVQRLMTKPSQDVSQEENLKKPLRLSETHFTRISDKPPSDANLQQQQTPESIVTQYHLDTSMKMEQSFAGDGGKGRLLTELQFSFVAFLLFHIYDCFTQWKELVQLVCLSDSALEEYPSFYSNFAKILHTQIQHVPEDLFEDIVESNNLIRTVLGTFFQNVDECPRKDKDLIKQVQVLRDLTIEKFAWQYELERDDEQPVIVEL